MSLKRSRKASRPPNRRARIPRSSRGVALIAVLWVVLLLSVIAGSLAILTRTEVGLSRNFMLSAKAEALAEGGVHLAIGELLAPGAAARPYADGGVWQVELEAGRLKISIIDVTGRVDLNSAPLELVVGLFSAAGAEPELADILAGRIIDWRDADETSLARGGEQADYEGHEPPVRVGNGPFLAADEIMRIPGMTADLWVRIADAVTVYSRHPGVNPIYAPKIVLLALPGMDAATAERIISARNEAAPNSAGRPAQRVTEIANLIPPEARRYLAGGSSNIYAVRARAELPEGAVYIIEAVIELAPANDPPWRIHEWRPGTVD
jgi:general secretion pathway protein K